MFKFSKKSSSDVPRRRQQLSDGGRPSDEDLERRYMFRRNQTLTGSASSRVSALSESNAHLKSPRVQAHELTTRRRHLGLTLLGVLVGAAALYGLISQFTAEVVVTTGDDSVQLTSVYGKTIQQYYGRWPVERLRFLLNVDQLTRYVQAADPEVAAVKVAGSAGFGRTALQLTMRRPVASWSMGGARQYVDSSGVAFTRNYYAAPSVQIVDDSGIRTADGRVIASNQFLSFVGRVVGVAGRSGYTVEKVIIPFGTTRQVELRLKGISYPIKLSVDRPVGDQVEDMSRAIGWMERHHLTPQYIDVRVSGSAYYR